MKISKHVYARSARRTASSRKLWVGIGLALTVFMYSACQKEEATPVDGNEPETAHPVWQRIVELGFAKEDIEDKGDYYLVEKDIRFSKHEHTGETDESALPGGRMKHSGTHALVGYMQQSEIAVGIDVSVPEEWLEDIYLAVNDWNEIPNSRINLYITDGSEVDIRIRAEALPPDTDGMGSFPANNASGNTIILNLNKSSDFRRRAALVHTIGHCLGLRHTDRQPKGEISAPEGIYPVLDTPRDSNSVMNSASLPNRQLSWQGFSEYDSKNLQRLYPESYAGDRVYDIDFYLSHPDIARMYANNPEGAMNHWLGTGIAEGRVASFLFDADYYMTLNTDLELDSRQAAVEHWLNYGANEGRLSSPTFEVRYYLDNNPDLQAYFGSNGYQKAYRHWLNEGIPDGRNASQEFNVHIYLQKNPDLKERFGDDYRAALLHWIWYGKNEGREGI